jgi:Porin PorA
MRRVSWSVLTGLGVFFIVLAILSKFFVPGQAVKFPLNEYTTTTLQATGASYFSEKSVNEESGVTLQATMTTKGDVAAAKSTGNSNKIAVWQSYTAIEDVSNHQPVSIPTDGNTLAFDRKTGALVPWSGNSVAGKPIQVTGNEQGTLFPLNTQKKSYQVFDTTLLKPVTCQYKGTSTTGGVSTYVFSASIPSTQIGTKSLPGSLVGLSASEVTLPEFYTEQETWFVDPVTGVPLATEQKVRETLQDNSGTTRLVLLDADFKTTPASVTSGVNTVNGASTKITVLNVIVPIVAGVIGIILLVLGLVLSRGRPEDDQYEDDDETVRVPA